MSVLSVSVHIYCYSPRAREGLFMFLSAKGLTHVSYAKFSQEFKNQSLTNTKVAVFSEIDFKDGYPRV